MAVAALIVSVVALLVGGGSLGWQVYSWRRNGAVVGVTVAHAFLAPPWQQEVEHQMQVTAHNSGRAPVTVTSWGFQLSDGRSLVATRVYPWSSPLPFRLEPSSEGSWFWDADELRRLCGEEAVAFADVVAFVGLAGGARVLAKSGLPFAS